MILCELFDNTNQFQMKENTDDRFSAVFGDVGNRYEFVAARNTNPTHKKANIWYVCFAASDKPSGKFDMNKLSDPKLGLNVMSTVMSILKKMIAEKNPVGIEFSSAKSESSRTSLYTKMIQRMLPQGWTVDATDYGADTNFTLRAPRTNVTELFDRPSRTEIITQNRDKFKAVAEIKGRDIYFVAEYEESGDQWDIVFYETDEYQKAQYKMTGSGGEIEVMSTIKDLMTTFFQMYDPRSVSFSSNINDSGRTKLYRRMIGKFVPSSYEIDSEISRDDFGGSETFTIRKKGTQP